MMNFFGKNKRLIIQIISVSVVVILTIAMAVSVFAQELPDVQSDETQTVSEPVESPKPEETDKQPEETPTQAPTKEPAQPSGQPRPEPTPEPSTEPTVQPSTEPEATLPEVTPEPEATQEQAPMPQEPEKEAEVQGRQEEETKALEPADKGENQTPVYSSPAVFLGDIAAKGSNETLLLSDEQLAEIEKTLPEGLDPYRREVVLKAYSLVGNVKYFWGGKSTESGWDIRWGNEAIVGSAGSSQTGTTREYGLDCSGYVLWCFLNAEESMLMQQEPAQMIDKSAFVNQFGYGTSGQWEHSSEITWEEAQPGDVLFYKNPQDVGINHIGIIVGTDEDGNMLAAHCSSSKNSVIVSKAEHSGFRYVRRMNYIAGRELGQDAGERAAETTALPDGMPMYLTDEQAYNDAIRNGWSVD